jgi:predicted nucleic acid-binding protein
LARLQILDSSVLIPWLRDGSYDQLVTASFTSRQSILCTVVWMELYAGTRSASDKRDLDRMVQALADVGRVISPQPKDFYQAGQMIAYYARQYGAIQPRDHANDVLIALCASRVSATLITENEVHMEKWQRILKRSGRKLDLQYVSRAQ